MSWCQQIGLSSSCFSKSNRSHFCVRTKQNFFQLAALASCYYEVELNGAGCKVDFAHVGARNKGIRGGGHRLVSCSLIATYCSFQTRDLGRYGFTLQNPCRRIGRYMFSCVNCFFQRLNALLDWSRMALDLDISFYAWFRMRVTVPSGIKHAPSGPTPGNPTPLTSNCLLLKLKPIPIRELQAALIIMRLQLQLLQWLCTLSRTSPADRPGVRRYR